MRFFLLHAGALTTPYAGYRFGSVIAYLERVRVQHDPRAWFCGAAKVARRRSVAYMKEARRCASHHGSLGTGSSTTAVPHTGGRAQRRYVAGQPVLSLW